MNINPVSMAKINTARNAKTNNAQKINNVQYQPKNNVSFQGNSLKKLIAGIAAAAAIIAGTAPFVRAETSNNLQATPISTSQTSAVPTQPPLPMPTGYNPEQSGSVSQTTHPTLPGPTIYIPDEMSQKELDEMLKDSLIRKHIPEANFEEAGDDLIIVSMKQETNAKIMRKAADTYRNEALDIANSALGIVETAMTFTDTNKQLSYIYQAESKMGNVENLRRYAKMADSLATDYQTAYERTENRIQSYSNDPMPTSPRSDFPSIPNIDTKGMIMGYEGAAKDYVQELLPKENLISESDSQKTANDKTQKNIEILRNEAARLKIKAVIADIEGEIVYSKLLEAIRTGASSDEISDLAFGVASKRTDVIEYNGIANKLVEFADSGKSSYYTADVQKDSSSYSAVEEEQKPLQVILKPVPSKPKEPTPPPAPTMAPPIVYPCIDTIQDFMSSSEYAQYIAGYVGDLFEEGNTLTDAEKLSIVSSESSRLKEDAAAKRAQANELRIQLEKDWQDYFASGNGSMKDLEARIMQVAALEKSAEQTDRIVRNLDKIVESEKLPSSSVMTPPAVPTMPDSTPTPVLFPVKYPEIYGYYDGLTDEQYISQVAFGLSNAFREGTTEDEKLRLIAIMSQNSKNDIETWSKQVNDLEKEVETLWNQYYSTGEGSKEELQEKVNQVAILRKNIEREEREVKVLDNIVETGVIPEAPEHPYLPATTPPLPTIPDYGEPTPVPTEEKIIGCTIEDILGYSLDEADEPESAPSPIPTEPEVIGCTYEDIFGRPEPKLPTPPPSPVPTETQIIGCTIEDILGHPINEPKPTPPAPVPTKPQVIGCTIEDILGHPLE